MARVVLITGGNVGDAERRLGEAAQLIDAEVGRVVSYSRVYRTKAWGFEAEDFRNQVLVVESDLEPMRVLEAVNDIECRLGRDRAAEQEVKSATGARYASRSIDIDILFYDDLIVESERLTLPHPRIAEREFVLEPLAEVVAEWQHPISGKSVQQMYDELKLR
ncbi:MAG: 2-amino-4-hydroxy-6-hydroxymethyldihydropteridine diphosphokinase [Alistipes sp.]|nr:2-amino-4-hydroxy-6-hydroxymethyldihydropteridine diphosphokinase [Alistipes sp.]